MCSPARERLYYAALCWNDDTNTTSKALPVVHLDSFQN